MFFTFRLCRCLLLVSTLFFTCKISVNSFFAICTQLTESYVHTLVFCIFGSVRNCLFLQNLNSNYIQTMKQLSFSLFQEVEIWVMQQTYYLFFPIFFFPSSSSICEISNTKISTLMVGTQGGFNCHFSIPCRVSVQRHSTMFLFCYIFFPRLFSFNSLQCTTKNDKKNKTQKK
jgi:hypothetical protein